MKNILIPLLFIITIATANAEPVDLDVNHHEVTKHQLNLDSDNFEQYRELAASIGLDYDAEYSYREFADIKRANKIGEAGSYEFLMYSTGGDVADDDTYLKFSKAQIAWESMYYSNHDLTMIKQVRNSGDGSYIKLLKLSKGRDTDLYLH